MYSHTSDPTNHILDKWTLDSPALLVPSQSQWFFINSNAPIISKQLLRQQLAHGSRHSIIENHWFYATQFFPTCSEILVSCFNISTWMFLPYHPKIFFSDSFKNVLFLLAKYDRGCTTLPCITLSARDLYKIHWCKYCLVDSFGCYRLEKNVF